jgi:LPXTG-motif cell wall-anchored protein
MKKLFVSLLAAAFLLPAVPVYAASSTPDYTGMYYDAWQYVQGAGNPDGIGGFDRGGEQTEYGTSYSNANQNNNDMLFGPGVKTLPVNTQLYADVFIRLDNLNGVDPTNNLLQITVRNSGNPVSAPDATHTNVNEDGTLYVHGSDLQQGKFVNLQIPFTLDTTPDVQVVIYWNKNNDTQIDWTIGNLIITSDPTLQGFNDVNAAGNVYQSTIEAENTQASAIGNGLGTAGADGYVSLQKTSNTVDGTKALVSEGFDAAPAGQNYAFFCAKVTLPAGDTSTDNVGTIKISNGSTVLASRSIKRAEVTGDWQVFAVPVTLTGDEKLSASFDWNNNANVDVDKVVLSSAPSYSFDTNLYSLTMPTAYVSDTQDTTTDDTAIDETPTDDTTTDTSTDTSTETTDIPKTGESSSVLPVIILLAAASAAGIFFVNKKVKTK